MNYWLIETEDQLNILKNSGYKEAFIEVIPYNFNEHPCNNYVSLVYIKPFDASKGYMLCLHHSETFSLDKTLIDITLKGFETLYVRDKKEILHYFPLNNLKSLVFPPTSFKPVLTQTHNIFYNRLRNNSEINIIIPIVKHYEYCENILRDIEKITLELDDYVEFFNNKVSLVFNSIERNGIKVDKEKFEKYFHPINGEYVFTKYNLNTLTTRPSNSFKGVNYAALNKNNKCREAFIPRNDKFIEYDIISMHPHIAAYLSNYILPHKDIYEDFSKYCGEDRETAKTLMFKQLYGFIYPKYKNYPFFKEISKFIEKSWVEYNSKKGVSNFISKYIFSQTTHPQLTKNKLFNYLIQSTEIAMFTNILYYIIKNTRGMESKIILYNYDSFIYDIKIEEESLINTQVSNALALYNLPFTIKKGKNYDNLK